MHSIPGWKLARRPNYITNIDLSYPYSEVPFLGEYHLLKLPYSTNTLIEHVDYWGEGKINTPAGISGFSNCYNVNHTYQLVSNGPDRDRKIPNRIPVVNYTNCDTSSYIKDNSVKTVTIMGAPINNSCAEDIARMINTDVGQVIAYGFDSDSSEIRNITTELKKKGLFHCPSYELPQELQGLTLFYGNMAFLNLTALKDELYKKVTNGSYDDAVELAKNMDNEHGTEAISNVVTQLLLGNEKNVMIYAFKLWKSGATEIVRNNFPSAFKYIFNEDIVTIVNENYHQALKISSNDNKLAYGDNSDTTSKRVSWKFISMWENGNVVFKIKNIDSDLYLKLDENADILGARKAIGSIDNDEISHTYLLEPFMKDGTVVFLIINRQYNQALKMDLEVDSNGDRQLWGHSGNPHSGNKNLNWIIASNTKLWEKQSIEI